MVEISRRRYEIILAISFLIACLISQQILIGHYLTYTKDYDHHLTHYDQQSSSSSSSSHYYQTTSNIEPNYNYDPPALPSVLISPSEKIDRGIYGGKIDKPHLGGFTNIDFNGLSPRAFQTMIETIGIKSLLDIGCGKGLSTSYFLKMGVDVLCAEGSHDAVTQTLLPPERVIEHDFSRGPWWPAGGKTFDAVWCVEFLEHVGRNYHANYVPAFKRAALIFATHSNWGGWHHVEVHDDDWWITKMEMYGLRHSPYLTDLVRRRAEEGVKDPVGRSGNKFFAQHIWLSMMVFINPSVASLPKHHHLLAEAGCYSETEKGKIHRDCNQGEETPLPKEWKPLKVRQSKVDEWIAFLEDSLGLEKVETEEGDDEGSDEEEEEEDDEEEDDEEEEEEDDDKEGEEEDEDDEEEEED